MAEHLKMATKQVIIQCAMASAAVVVMTPAFAQALADPTRPPASLGAEQASTGPASTAGPVLQSVLISPRRKEAIISGQTVKIGDKFGEATVVKITENEVVLRSGKESQTLKLFPNIEKRSYTSRAGSRIDNRRP